MTDIATIWVPDQSRGDWLQQGAVLASGNDLETAVLISLFSDRMAALDDVLPDTSKDPRGWWGSAGETVEMGSRLWLLDRAKLTNETATRAKAYATEALQWMIDDGVAVRVDIDTQIKRPDRLDLSVVVYRRDGSHVALSYGWTWKNVT